MNTLEILKRPVKEYMTTDVITVLTNSQLEEAKAIFDTNSIHHLPVVDDENRLEGIISKTDLLLLMDWGTKYDLTSSKRKNAFLLKSNLAIDLMEENVVTVGADDTVEKCYDIFKENYFHAIPVVDQDHKLIGLITTYDLLIAAYSQPMAVK
jgi:CBS-domain-containing membrane protein